MTDGRQVSEHFLCFLVTSRRSRLFWKQWAADLDKKRHRFPVFVQCFQSKLNLNSQLRKNTSRPSVAMKAFTFAVSLVFLWIFG